MPEADRSTVPICGRSRNSVQIGSRRHRASDVASCLFPSALLFRFVKPSTMNEQRGGCCRVRVEVQTLGLVS